LFFARRRLCKGVNWSLRFSLIAIFSVFIFYTNLGSTSFLILMDCSYIGCSPIGGTLTEGTTGWWAVGGSPRAQGRAAWLRRRGGAAREQDNDGGASPSSWSSRHARSLPCLEASEVIGGTERRHRPLSSEASSSCRKPSLSLSRHLVRDFICSLLDCIVGSIIGAE
jgi:hypothetical protein